MLNRQNDNRQSLSWAAWEEAAVSEQKEIGSNLQGIIESQMPMHRMAMGRELRAENCLIIPDRRPVCCPFLTAPFRGPQRGTGVDDNRSTMIPRIAGFSLIQDHYAAKVEVIHILQTMVGLRRDADVERLVGSFEA